MGWLYKGVIDNLSCAQHWSPLPQITGQKTSLFLSHFVPNIPFFPIPFFVFIIIYGCIRKEDSHTYGSIHWLHLISSLLLQRTDSIRGLDSVSPWHWTEDKVLFTSPVSAFNLWMTGLSKLNFGCMPSAASFKEICPLRGPVSLCW